MSVGAVILCRFDSRRLPGKTDEEKKIKQEAIQAGLKEAVMVPLNTAKWSAEVLNVAEKEVDFFDLYMNRP